jgi:Tol biopolymer transport system component
MADRQLTGGRTDADAPIPRPASAGNGSDAQFERGIASDVPDGPQRANASDRRHDLWLWNGRKTSTRVFGEHRKTAKRPPEVSVSGHLSSDGKRLAYSVGQSDWDIVEFGLNGQRRRPLAATSRVEVDADWSTGGDQFVYSSNALGPTDLWIRSSDGHRTARILGGGDDGVFSPRISSDGRRIAYRSGRRQLRVVPVEGGRFTTVFESAGDLEFPPAWSPDGEFIAITDTRGILKVPVQRGAADVIKRGIQSEVKWSPNGKWIAYLRAFQSFHVISADGREDYQLGSTSSRFLRGDFSPDSKTFIHVRTVGPHQWQLVTLDIPTGRQLKSVPLQIDDGDDVRYCDIHPDGKRVALTVGGLRYDIWMLEGFLRPTSGLSRLFRRWTVPR